MCSKKICNHFFLSFSWNFSDLNEKDLELVFFLDYHQFFVYVS